MSTKNDPHQHYEENFKMAAVEFLHSQGSNVEVAAAELGVDAADLRSWKRKLGAPAKPAKPLGAMARLRAENDALRTQIESLHVQWDILKTTLGVLTTTVCTHES